MQDEIVYEKLKQYPKYRELKIKKRVGLLFLAIFLSFLWYVMLNPTRGSGKVIESASDVVFLVILGILSLAIYPYSFQALFTKFNPSVVTETEVKAVKVKKRRFDSEAIDRPKATITHLYKVEHNGLEYWAMCATTSHFPTIGERVYFTAYNQNDPYIYAAVDVDEWIEKQGQ